MKNKTVYLAGLDDVTSQKLIEIARRHCKLAIEHLDKDTSYTRRQAISTEIESLRVEWSEILST